MARDLGKIEHSFLYKINYADNRETGMSSNKKGHTSLSDGFNVDLQRANTCVTVPLLGIVNCAEPRVCVCVCDCGCVFLSFFVSSLSRSFRARPASKHYSAVKRREIVAGMFSTCPFISFWISGTHRLWLDTQRLQVQGCHKLSSRKSLFS